VVESVLASRLQLQCALSCTCDAHRLLMSHGLSSSSHFFFFPFLSSLPSFILYFFPSVFPSSLLPSCFPLFVAEYVGSNGEFSGGHPARNSVWAQGNLTESLRGFRRAFQLKGVAPLNSPRSHVPQSLLICCGRFHRVDYWTKQLLQFARHWYITHEWSVFFINYRLSFLLTGIRCID
jgi:hypothetical protein